MRHLSILVLLLVLGALTVPLSSAHISDSTYTLYFNDETQTAAGMSAYYLTDSYTSDTQDVEQEDDPGYSIGIGYRVYLVSGNATKIELTNGVEAIENIGGDFTGTIETTWDCSGFKVYYGFQALEVDLYSQFGYDGWLLKASFLSDYLQTSRLETATWTFNTTLSLDVGPPTTVLTITFGNGAGFVEGVVLDDPIESEIMTFRLNTGDVVGFTLGAYIDRIGVGFYLLVLLMLTGALWFNYKHIGPVLFVFAMFGGSGGLIWIFVPPVAAVVVDALLLIGFAALIYKVTRN